MLKLLLLCCWDIHPNPSPDILDSSSNQPFITAFSSAFVSTIDLSKNLSMVHYNAQSIRAKLIIFFAELHCFGILAFSETWLNDTIWNEDLTIPSLVVLLYYTFYVCGQVCLRARVKGFNTLYIPLYVHCLSLSVRIGDKSEVGRP